MKKVIYPTAKCMNLSVLGYAEVEEVEKREIHIY
jgi:hypothetical protein